MITSSFNLLLLRENKVEEEFLNFRWFSVALYYFVLIAKWRFCTFSRSAASLANTASTKVCSYQVGEKGFVVWCVWVFVGNVNSTCLWTANIVPYHCLWVTMVPKLGKSFTSQVTREQVLMSGFCSSVKRLRVFDSPLEGALIHHRLAPSRCWYSFTFPGRVESWTSLGGKEGRINIQIAVKAEDRTRDLVVGW